MLTGEKVKERAEKANTLKIKLNKAKHKLRQVQNLKIRLFQIIPFTVTVQQLSDSNSSNATAHIDGNTPRMT